MALVVGLCCVATATRAAQDVLAPAPPGTVQVSGWLGRKLEVSLQHRGMETLVATQTPDGYIGTCKQECHLGIWNVWGRKYTLLGLLAHYDLTGDAQALAAARKLADHLLTEAPPGRFNLAENGIAMEGQARRKGEGCLRGLGRMQMKNWCICEE
jgi:hypothetical protein